MSVAIFVILGLVSGGVWGGTIARLAGTANERRMQAAGALTLLPSILLSIWVLITLDDLGVFASIGLEKLENHTGYTVIFVASTIIVATLSSLTVSWVAVHWRLALRIAILTGLGAGAGFLLVSLIMAAFGVKVGGVRAGIWRTLTPMPVITVLGTIAGSMVGGGVLGWLLTREGEHR